MWVQGMTSILQLDYWVFETRLILFTFRSTEMKAAARNACLEEDFNMWDPGKWTSCYTGWMAPIFTALLVFLANLVLFTYIIGVVR